MKTNVKTLLSIALVFVLVAITGLSFAYWDNLTTVQNETINVGVGTAVEVNAVAEAPAGKVLVPAGVIMGPNDVDEIVLTYNVKLSKEAAEALDLSVVVSNIEIDSSVANAGLVTVTPVLGSPTVNNSDVLVTVTVTLTEPGSQAVYDAINGKAITFTLTFTATPA